MHAKIFDIDGTLLQSAAVDDQLYRQAVRSVLGEVRFRASLNDYEFVSDSGVLRHVLMDNGLSESKEEVAEIKARFLGLLRAHFDEHGPFPEMPGARAFFDRIRSTDDCSVGIATGGWRHTAIAKLESTGFDITDVPLASSDDSLDRKEIMEISLSMLGDDRTVLRTYVAGELAYDRDDSSLGSAT